MGLAANAASFPLLAMAFLCSPKAEAEYNPWGLGIDARVAFGQEESSELTRHSREGDSTVLGLAVSLPLNRMLNARLSGEKLAFSGDRLSSFGGFNPTYDETRQLVHAELLLHRPRQTGAHPYLSVGLISQQQELVLREQQIDGGSGEIVPVRAVGRNDLDGLSLGAGVLWLADRYHYGFGLQRRLLERNNRSDADELIIRMTVAWHARDNLAVDLGVEQYYYEGINNNRQLELLSLGLGASWRF